MWLCSLDGDILLHNSWIMKTEKAGLLSHFSLIVCFAEVSWAIPLLDGFLPEPEGNSAKSCSTQKPTVTQNNLIAMSTEMWRKGGICHNVTEIISAHVQKESTVSRWQEAVAKLLFQLWDEKYSRILSWFSSYNIHSQHRIKCQPKLVGDARPGDERPGRVCWAYIKGSQWYKIQPVEVAVEIIMKNWIRAAVPNTHTWPSLRFRKNLVLESSSVTSCSTNPVLLLK